MTFLFNNSETGTFVEFEIRGEVFSQNPKHAVLELIEKFTMVGTACENNFILPDKLLECLSDAELNIILMMSYSKEAYRRVLGWIYIEANNRFLRDKHNFKYEIEYIGAEKTYISYESAGKPKVIEVDNNSISDDGFVIIESSEKNAQDWTVE